MSFSKIGITDHPRIRGEHVGDGAPEGRPGGSSPHTRGAQPVQEWHELRRGIIPAYAGSTLVEYYRNNGFRDHPRIRGEHLRDTIIDAQQKGSSPHTRGAPRRRSARRCPWGIIPAYAGSTLQNKTPSSPTMGSSPHTRGARNPCPPTGSCRRIIPAYAGSTWRRRTRRSMSWDHPRIRGEHAMFGDFHPPSFGSSPHTRGARPSASCPPAARRIIPAYAGSTDSAMVSLQSNRDHPRIRGEHRAVLADRGRDDGSSPHTRGARGQIRPRRAATCIIPAYAGSTLRPVGR